MGGMTSDITQSARLCGRGRDWVSRGSLVFGCPLAGFAFLPGSRHNRRRVLWRCWRHSGYGEGEGDRLNRCQSHIGLGVTRRGGGWGIKVPDRYAQGQVREREGGHDGDRIYSERGSEERDLPSREMTRRDGFKMVEARMN